ncbi:hypothetical protein [Prescottella agglutinans]|jgi:hypothetical protein|uniref:Uncharacterized protein n=1 Tax=Prescottella agglutinans TaxID=1644129 RepID=A0ABT6MJR8_9NOCA|nr:hypothetical protein [Prescottella agglutinans]MDH6284566.1 hypothetical protein [Prescottella agglutinans]
MCTIAIPADFEAAFIALANESNDDPDPLDLGISEDRLRLHLSNNFPGYSPYLELAQPDAGEAIVAIRATTGTRGPDGEWAEREVTAATVTVDLEDPHNAARKALDCWISTL